jgi:DNA-binding transcriptional regulator YbjK
VSLYYPRHPNHLVAKQRRSCSISLLVLKAAQLSVRSAAFELATAYVGTASAILCPTLAESWTQHPEQSLQLAEIATAVARGLHDPSMGLEIVRAFTHCENDND